MHYEIRKARPEDCGTVCELIHALAAYEKLSDACHATPEAIREALFAGNPVAHCLLCREVDEEDRAPSRDVAFALYFFNFSTFEARKGLYLEDLFVVEDARGRGVGTMMIKHLAEIAEKENCARFEWVVLDWNKPAQAFYKKLGADIHDEWWLCRLSGEQLAACAKGADKAASDAPKERSGS